MRTSQQLTQQEIDKTFKFCVENNLVLEGEIGTKNANHLVDNLLQSNIEATDENLKIVLDKLRDRIAFYTPLQIEYNKLAARMSPEQRQLILNFISRRGLKDEDDSLLQNFITISSWMLDHNYPIAANTLDGVLSNITNNSRRPLLWKKRLQDSEAEAQRQKEAVKAMPTRNTEDDIVIPPGLPAHLHAHYRMMHRKSEAEDTNKPVVDQGVWKARAESLDAGSNLDNAAIKKMYITAQGEIDWPATYRARLNFIEKRRNQRSLVGR